MLHLIPIRRLLSLIFSFVALAVLAAAYAGVVGSGDVLADISWIIRLSAALALALMLLPYAAWRWLPSLQRATFPYLGGKWVGSLRFYGPNGAGTRQVDLVVSHSLLKIVLILDSAESTSRTLVVHAERDAGLGRDRLYYVYLNERKEGISGAGSRYRGLAVLRIEMSERPMLLGDYFTEEQGSGTLELARRQSYPWWMLWK